MHAEIDFLESSSKDDRLDFNLILNSRRDRTTLDGLAVLLSKTGVHDLAEDRVSLYYRRKIASLAKASPDLLAIAHKSSALH